MNVGAVKLDAVSSEHSVKPVGNAGSGIQGALRRSEGGSCIGCGLLERCIARAGVGCGGSCRLSALGVRNSPECVFEGCVKGRNLGGDEHPRVIDPRALQRCQNRGRVAERLVNDQVGDRPNAGGR